MIEVNFIYNNEKIKIHPQGYWSSTLCGEFVDLDYGRNR